MNGDGWRWALVGLLCGLALVRGWARWQAGRSRLAPDVAAEGRALLVARLLLAAPVFALAFVHTLAPGWADPWRTPLPASVRALGGLLALLALAGLTWAHAVLGRHFSPTLRVDRDQVLVTSGPYRWLRHPIYSAYLAFFVGLGLLSADPLFGAAGVAVIALLMVVRTPREERMLAEHFGDAYYAWAARTGRFLPRVPAPLAYRWREAPRVGQAPSNEEGL